MKQQLLKIWNCYIWDWHDWTSLVQQGIKPTPDQVNRGVEGFKEYTHMWCEHCGKPSKYNL